MKKIRHEYIIIFGVLIVVNAVSCKSTEYGYAIKGERSRIWVEEKPNTLNYAALKKQVVPSLSDRSSAMSEGSLISPLLGGAISLFTNAVKQMIANDRKKYVADYSCALTDLYFYDQLSIESPFDPLGMQFSGFTLSRTFITKAGTPDTAFRATFYLDTTKTNEIINNSIFRLKLKDLELNYSKAKITNGQKKSINMDIEISFVTSYVNDQGQLFDKVELGKFYLLIRDAPLDKKSEGYDAYYDKLKGKLVDGKSFIVPRSFGYYIAANGTAARSFSQGAYSIIAKVKESSKDKFITKVLVDNSSQLLDALGSKAKDVLKKSNF